MNQNVFLGQMPKYGNLGPDPQKNENIIFMWNVWELRFQRALNHYQMITFH